MDGEANRDVGMSVADDDSSEPRQGFGRPPDWFADLGVPRKAVLSEDELREALHAAGRRWHPDSGSMPDAARFERANAAAVGLRDPAPRLRRLLELAIGPEAVARGGVLDSGLMDLFAEAGPLVQAADDLIGRRRAAGSALARALLEPECIALHPRLAAMIRRIDDRARNAEERLGEVDALLAGASPDEAAGPGNAIYRELAFLGKWRRQLQDRVSGLV